MPPSTTPWADDCLDREKFGRLLLACLQGDAILCDETFVVALTGRFGSGKSFFVERWQRDIAAKAKADPEEYPMVVRVNAWDSDFSGEPLLALVSAIFESLAAESDTQRVEMQEIQRGVARLVSDLPAIRPQATSDTTASRQRSMSPSRAKTVLDGQTDVFDDAAAALFTHFGAKKRAIGDVRNAIGSFIASHSKIKEERELRLILIVDELDRCHPHYAIEFLEALKHVVNVQGLAVVLAVDWDQLSCTARSLFGQGLDADEYLRKFIKRRVPLPESHPAHVDELCARLVRRYFRNRGGESNGWDPVARSASNAPKILGAFLQALRLTPRQAESAFHVLSYYYRIEALERGLMGKRPHFCMEFFVAAVFVVSPDLFKKFLESPDSIDALRAVRSFQLAAGLGKAGLDGEYIEGTIVGCLRTHSNNLQFDQLLHDVGYRTGEGVDAEQLYADFLQGVKAVHVHQPGLLGIAAKKMAELGVFAG